MPNLEKIINHVKVTIPHILPKIQKFKTRIVTHTTEKVSTFFPHIFTLCTFFTFSPYLCYETKSGLCQHCIGDKDEDVNKAFIPTHLCPQKSKSTPPKWPSKATHFSKQVYYSISHLYRKHSLVSQPIYSFEFEIKRIECKTSRKVQLINTYYLMES